MKKYPISKFFLSLLLLTLFLGCATQARTAEIAQADDLPVLADIRQQENGISIVGSRNFTYTLYTGNDPYKVTIEIPEMRLGNFKNKIVWDRAGISEIYPQQIDGSRPSVRLDILLQSPSAVVPLYKDNTLTLLTKPEEPLALKQDKTEETVEAKEAPGVSVSASTSNTVAEGKSAGTGAAMETETPEIKHADTAAAAAGNATSIDRIELKKSAGELKVLIAGDGAMKPDVFPVHGKIVIDIPGVSMHATLPSSVMPPLKGIRAGKHKGKVRLVLDLKEKTTFDVTAAGNTIEISLKAGESQIAQVAPKARKKSKAVHKDTIANEQLPKEAQPPAVQESRPEELKGKRISLDFQDADVGPIFRLLADVNNYNLVLDPGVKGKITIKLMNVPWDQALDIVARQSNLAYRVERNILYVAPTSVFEKLAQDQFKMEKAQQENEPLVQEVVRINYASAAEIQSAINSAKLFSSRGSFTIDSRMNTLIIKDTQTSIDKIKELVKIMDVSKPQVLIEAKLVEVGTTYAENLGIRWGGSFSSQAFPNNVGGNFSVNTPTVAAGPATTNPGGTMNLTFGHANTLSVNLSLSALESIGQTKTLSNPKILTMDNEAANIQQGTTFYIPTVSQAGTQTQSQTATLSLDVTPKITPDGFIQLKVNASDNSLQPGTAGANAVVNTKSLKTQALVKNGETLVIGGIYRLDDSESSDGVPALSKIPGLGWLFKTRNRTHDIKELLIFITPTIVSQPL
ncbi:putative Type IV pilus biogenesis and competence protein PilQ [Candidatus Sulfobium mesophilum]|uniref:Putative Type IV pilus biogenesis and competence protein PilQ n=1 Tax=Candidatus Sulfobium mesophilum TaxID=2016548 RepID=A0A2U3QGZ3_9BACT|nr:putative Type IV pilus biogenesis and competence protein PilQ [Candidatus Sulfobium mesophilum]